MRKLTENVFVESRYYPTAGFVVTPDGVVAIDGPMSPALATEWCDAIASKGPLRYLIHTEHHADHIAAGHYLPGTAVASEWTRAHFLDGVGSAEALRERLRERYPEGAHLLEGYAVRFPEITFSERLTLSLGGRTFNLLHAPGHTPGEVMVHAVEEGVVFTGDNVVTGHPPFFHDAWAPGWLRSLDGLEALGAERLVPGHGEPCGPDFIPWLRGFLLGIIGEVRRARERGLTREEAQDALHYIDRAEFDSPRLGRAHLERLERASIGVIYDQLDELPAG